MSDVLTKYKSLCITNELKDIEITEPEFHYANNRCCDAVFGLKIPFPLLKFWHGLVKDGGDLGDVRVRYVKLLEWNIPGNSFVFVDDVEVRDEIDDHVFTLAGSVVSLYKNTKSRARKELDGRNKVIHIKKGHIKSVNQWREEVERLENSVEEWRKSYSNLEQSSRELYLSLVREIQQKDQEISELQNVNKELSKYITSLEGTAYKGKPLSQAKNKKRTMKCFLSRAQSALWFSKHFGIEIESLIIKANSGQHRRVDLNTTKSTDVSAENNPNDGDGNDNGADSGFDSLPAVEKAKVEKVLFLLDKFCVGDMFYHEFSFHL